MFNSFHTILFSLETSTLRFFSLEVYTVHIYIYLLRLHGSPILQHTQHIALAIRLYDYMCWRCLMNLPLAFLVTLGDCALMTLCRVRVKRMPTLLALQRRLFTGWMMVGWFHSWKHNCGIEQLELLLVTLGARVMLVTPITLVCWFRWHRCVW